MKYNNKFDNTKIQRIGRITSICGIIFLSFYIIIGITLSIISNPKQISLIGIILLSCALIFSIASILCFKKVNIKDEATFKRDNKIDKEHYFFALIVFIICLVIIIYTLIYCYLYLSYGIGKN